MTALLVAPVATSPLKARCCYCTGIYREGREPITDGIDYGFGALVRSRWTCRVTRGADGVARVLARVLP